MCICGHTIALSSINACCWVFTCRPPQPPTFVRQGDAYATALELPLNEQWKWAGPFFNIGAALAMGCVSIVALSRRSAAHHHVGAPRYQHPIDTEGAGSSSSSSEGAVTQFADAVVEEEPQGEGAGDVEVEGAVEGEEVAPQFRAQVGGEGPPASSPLAPGGKVLISAASASALPPPTSAGSFRVGGADAAAAASTTTTPPLPVILLPPPPHPLALSWSGIAYGGVGGAVTPPPSTVAPTAASPAAKSAATALLLSDASGVVRPGVLVGIVCLPPPPPPAAAHSTADNRVGPAGRALLCVLAGRPTRWAPRGDVSLTCAAGTPRSAPIQTQAQTPTTDVVGTATSTATATDPRSVAAAAVAPRGCLYARSVALSLKDDAHAPYETVREALFVSANLRGVFNAPASAIVSTLLPPPPPPAVPHIVDSTGGVSSTSGGGGGGGDAASPEARHEAFIASVLAVCELTEEAHTPTHALLSRAPSLAARLRIAVELASNPSILCVEDPTSRLDAGHTRCIMRVLRRIAATGRGVLITLDSPVAETALECSEIALLVGGKQVYWGPTGWRAGVLLAKAVGVAEEEGGGLNHSGSGVTTTPAPLLPQPSFSSSSSSAVDVEAGAAVTKVSGADSTSSSDLIQRAAAAFARSGAAATTAASVSEPLPPGHTVSVSASALQASVAATPSATPLLYQLAYMQFRLAREEMRNVPLNLSRNVQFVAVGVFLGLLFTNCGYANDYKGANTQSALIFFLCSVAASTCCSRWGAAMVEQRGRFLFSLNFLTWPVVILSHFSPALIPFSPLASFAVPWRTT